jgi:maltooligosyltrehalose trehalohydrolase
VTEFRVWAPKPELVRLDVDGVTHLMSRSNDGWWYAEVAAEADARY